MQHNSTCHTSSTPLCTPSKEHPGARESSFLGLCLLYWAILAGVLLLHMSMTFLIRLWVGLHGVTRKLSGGSSRDAYIQATKE